VSEIRALKAADATGAPAASAIRKMRRSIAAWLIMTEIEDRLVGAWWNGLNRSPAE